jgi:hypothetical protein
MITLEEKNELTTCAKCVIKDCIHKYCFRRLAKEEGGLELCPNLIAAIQNKREFAVIERYDNYGNATAFVAHYTNDDEKDRITGKYIYNEACYDQYITYDLNFDEVRERINEVKNA